MTICIGALCGGGRAAIFATDRMLTNEVLSIEFEHPGKKVTHVSENCVALTSGDALVHTELLRAVLGRTQNLKQPSIAAIANIVKDCYQQARQEDIEDGLLRPRGFRDIGHYYENHRSLEPRLVTNIDFEMLGYDYGLTILLIGADSTGAHLYAVANPGVVRCFDAIGYHAIGSGLPHAINALIATERDETSPPEEMLWTVYQAKKRAEKAPGVGDTATDIGIVTADGIVALEQEQVARLDVLCPKPQIAEFDIEQIRAILTDEQGATDANSEETANADGDGPKRTGIPGNA